MLHFLISSPCRGGGPAEEVPRCLLCLPRGQSAGTGALDGQLTTGPHGSVRGPPTPPLSTPSERVGTTIPLGRLAPAGSRYDARVRPIGAIPFVVALVAVTAHLGEREVQQMVQAEPPHTNVLLR